MAKTLTTQQVLGFGILAAFIIYIVYRTDKQNKEKEKDALPPPNSTPIVVQTPMPEVPLQNSQAAPTTAGTVNMDGGGANKQSAPQSQIEQQANPFDDEGAKQAIAYLKGKGINVDAILAAGHSADYIMNFACGQGWSGAIIIDNTPPQQAPTAQ